MIEIDDYIGKKKKECRSSNLNIEFYGEGDTVIDQIPGAKTVVEQYSTIWLYLGNEQ